MYALSEGSYGDRRVLSAPRDSQPYAAMCENRERGLPDRDHTRRRAMMMLRFLGLDTRSHGGMTITF